MLQKVSLNAVNWMFSLLQCCCVFCCCLLNSLHPVHLTQLGLENLSNPIINNRHKYFGWLNVNKWIIITHPAWFCWMSTPPFGAWDDVYEGMRKIQTLPWHTCFLITPLRPKPDDLPVFRPINTNVAQSIIDFMERFFLNASPQGSCLISTWRC